MATGQVGAGAGTTLGTIGKRDEVRRALRRGVKVRKFSNPLLMSDSGGGGVVSGKLE